MGSNGIAPCYYHSQFVRQNIRLDWFRVTKDTRDAKPAIESTALECVAKAFHEEIRRTFLLSPIWKLHSFRACLCPQSQCVEIWVSRDWSINCLWCFDLIIMNTISSKRSTRPRCHFTNSRRNDLAKRSCSSTYSTLDVGVYCLPSLKFYCYAFRLQHAPVTFCGFQM